MANVKISALPASTTPLNGEELVPIVQSGVTKQVAVKDLNVGGELYIAQVADSSPISSVGASIVTKLFYSTTNGAATVTENTTYLFEGYFYLTGLTSSSSVLGFGFNSTATISVINGIGFGNKAALSSTISPIAPFNNANFIFNTTGNTATTGWGYVKGRLTTSTGGTITPGFSVSATSTNVVVKAGSYFMFTPLGSSSLVTIGSWT